MANQRPTKNVNAAGRPKGLSISRAINISEGKFWQTNWNVRQGKKDPLLIYDKAVLASKSYDMLDEKVEKDAAQPNPQRGQACALSSEHDTLRLDYYVKVFSVISQLHSCPSVEYRELLVNLINYFKEQDGYYELAQRYVNNIANGRFLWRNRRAARNIETVIWLGDKSYKFNSKEFNLDVFVYDNEDINEIARVMADTLAGNNVFIDISVTCFADLGNGMEVFPSQEMTMSDKKDDNVGKVLFSYEGSAGMHSQKIGNAIRTIDTWYPQYDTYQFPIPIETYGVSRNIGLVLRQNASTFYRLIDKYITKLDKAPREDLNFIIAVLIRGGLFGTANEDSKGEK